MLGLKQTLASKVAMKPTLLKSESLKNIGKISLVTVLLWAHVKCGCVSMKKWGGGAYGPPSPMTQGTYHNICNCLTAWAPPYLHLGASWTLNSWPSTVSTQFYTKSYRLKPKETLLLPIIYAKRNYEIFLARQCTLDYQYSSYLFCVW